MCKDLNIHADMPVADTINAGTQAFVNKLAFSHSDLPVVRVLVAQADAIADGLLQVCLARTLSVSG
jgi:hypothetical protein